MTGCFRRRQDRHELTSVSPLMQAFMMLAFFVGLGVLLYALHSMTTERVCHPSWASYPEGSHLKIAIVTMTDGALQSRKQKTEQVCARGHRLHEAHGCILHKAVRQKSEPNDTCEAAACRQTSGRAVALRACSA